MTKLAISQKGEQQIIGLCLDFYRDRRLKHTFDQVMDMIETTTEQVMGVLGARDEFEETDLQDILRRPSKYLGKSLGETTDQELEQLVKNDLLTRREYVVYFALPQLLGFPDAYGLGHGTLVSYSSCPQSVQTAISELVQSVLEGVDESVVMNTTSLRLLRLPVEACGPRRAISKASRQADDALHVLRLVYGKDVTLSSAIASRQSGVIAKTNTTKLDGFIRYVSASEDFTTRLGEVMLKERSNDLETRLRNAVRLYGMAIEATRPEIRFSLLTNALEGLLMTESDKESVTTRLAEKMALILESAREPRLTLFKRVKELYGLRSDFVHQSKDYKGITTEQVRELNEIFTSTLHRLLQLADQGYEGVQKRQGVKTIDGLVDELKFG